MKASSGAGGVESSNWGSLYLSSVTTIDDPREDRLAYEVACALSRLPNVSPKLPLPFTEALLGPLTNISKKYRGRNVNKGDFTARYLPIVFNQMSGSSDIRLPLDLDVVATENGQRQRSDQTVKDFADCLGAIAKQISK